MKILWASNAPWVSSGYGQTTARFTPKVRDLGHDVALFANYGLKGSPMDWGGMPVYPGMQDGWGNDVIAAYALHHFEGDRGAGWLWFLQDVWTMRSEKIRDYHVCAWAPVDHTPAPPKVIDFFKKNGAVPISMSKHGHQMFLDAGLHPIYVPHGIDTTLFRPIPQVREEARQMLGIPPDAFVYGMVGANTGTVPSRKAYPEVFQAFAMFHAKHPDSVLYCHTMASKMHVGLDLKRLAEFCGIPTTALVFVDQFAYTTGTITTSDMPPIYSAIDVAINVSYGEGFGMPIIEAQSCGVPIILCDNTAQSELLGGGWMVPSHRAWDEEQVSWWGQPRVEEIVEAMGRAYGVSAKIGRQAREFVVENYDLEHVMANYFKPALDTLAGMLEAPRAEPVNLELLKV